MAILPKVKLKALPGFPSSTTNGTGIAINKTGGNYTVSMDVSGFHVNTSDLASNNFYAVSWGNATTDNPGGSFALVPYSGLQTSSKVAITQPATGSTLTILDGVTAQFNASVTFTGQQNKTISFDKSIEFNASSDNVVITFQGSDTYVGRATTDTLLNKTLTAPTVTGATITTSTYNGNTWTAGTGTLTFGAGKALTVSNTLTFTGTDGSSVAFGAGGTALMNGGALGTPSSGVATNLTGTASGLTAGNVTTNANLTGDVTSVGNTTTISPSKITQMPPQGRLSLATATPVMAASQSAKTTIYYTPYSGNQCPIYNGTNMVPTAFAELSVATTDTTKNPAAIGASKVNDWFVWNDSGTIRLSHGPDWTSDTARSAGTALVMVNGILLNNASITNGPAASRGTYVGTTRSDSSSQLNWVFGGSATPALLNVWNAYNRVLVSTSAWESTSTWTYTSATLRTPNGSLNTRVSFVSGLAEDAVLADYVEACNLAAVTNSWCTIGFGLDSTTTADKLEQPQTPTNTGTLTTNVTLTHPYAPQLGAHFLQALEGSDGVNTSTFVGGGKMELRLTARM